MSSRALHRSNADFTPIELPSYPRPQQVNADGYEIDYDLLQPNGQKIIAIEQDLIRDELEGGEEAEEVDQDIGGEEDIDMNGIEADDEVENLDDSEKIDKEPLLSLADSLVLPYSLTQTRYHHLTSLLPHIFSHPAIPSHSKPRARPPPKGTFLFPTPPAPIQPLPNPEYHGPSLSAEAPKQGDSSKSAGTTEVPLTGTPPPTGKPSRPSRPKKPINEEWPAHEMECISRCTLSVGPISFPGTEIWVGRFVEPKVTLPKPQRAKPGERKEKRKSLASSQDSIKRSRARQTGVERSIGTPNRLHSRPPSSSSSHNPTPLRPNTPTAYAPRPPIYRPSPGPAFPVRPIPQPNRPTTASPHLIQLVNQAATRHAWLSALIYKAAGSTANQVELERLGKAVARLSRGEPIEDLAPPETLSATPGSGPSAASAAQAPGLAHPPAQPTGPNSTDTVLAPRQASDGSSINPTVSPMKTSTSGLNSHPTTSSVSTQGSKDTTATELPVVEANSNQAPATTADDSDSDSDVDMSGRPQVGGGSLPLHSDPAEQSDVQAHEYTSSVPNPAASASTTAGTTTAPSHPSIDPAQPDDSVSSAASPQSQVPPVSASTRTTQNPLISQVRDTPLSTAAYAMNPASHMGMSPGISPASNNAVISPLNPVTNSLASRPQTVAPLIPPLAASVPPLHPTNPPVPPFAQPPPPPQIATNTPPPPKPTYPLPPPFLLIAFKEQPTEKYLLPLGIRSFISRVGGEYVTGPRPPEPDSLSIPAPASIAVNREISFIPTQAELGSPTVPTASSEPTTESIAGTAPFPPIDPTVIIPVPTKPLRNRTRQSLGRHAKELPDPATDSLPSEPIPLSDTEVKAEPEIIVRSRPQSGLTPLPGQKPEAGTILISTILPSGLARWEKIEWDDIKKGLPFDNPEFWDTSDKPLTEVKEEPQEPSSPVVPQQPSRALRHARSTSDMAEKPQKPKNLKPEILNIASKDFVPAEGDVQPVTIRLAGIDDNVWKKMKNIAEITEKHDIERMFEHEPVLLDGIEVYPYRKVEKPSTEIVPLVPENQDPVTPGAPKIQNITRGLTSKAIELLRPTYLARKAAGFTELLKRVPTRSFLQTRVAEPIQEIIDATADKWAPRPYPISTKPLYQADENDNDEEEMIRAPEIEFSPPPNKKSKKGEESAVTFEVPVSYDRLDEKVAEGVKNSVLNARGGRSGRKYTKRASTGGDGGDKPKRQGNKGKRGVQNGICEGCGMENIKVWRRGPTGRSTLCSPCGDLFVAKKLPPLKRPGAMKAFLSANGGGVDGEDEGGDADEKNESEGEKGAKEGGEAENSVRDTTGLHEKDNAGETREVGPAINSRVDGGQQDPSKLQDDQFVPKTTSSAPEESASVPEEGPSVPIGVQDVENSRSELDDSRIDETETADPALTEHSIPDPAGTSVSIGFKEPGGLSHGEESGISSHPEGPSKEVETVGVTNPKAPPEEDKNMDVDP
ncbi:uncharacterized protein I206_100420 [Kwoniella pini CBS 10737]|uniref:GATA-type domain-containing protein n=1 Tax=Kwoniella pini CBS 10737 TaxID=1296096 RepID=A0A1B9IEA1_9TREE|nr:uncharacterized protein I206_00905 [Kwoniella pini CBS 10737]OCF53600.1 hypothetical protein I206_00905 [Kwoniella pini CBS 10737]